MSCFRDTKKAPSHRTRRFSSHVLALTNLGHFLLAINLTNSFIDLNRAIEVLVTHLLEHFNHILIRSLLLSMFDEILLLSRIIYSLEISLNLGRIGIRHNDRYLLLY